MRSSNPHIPYRREELFALGAPRVYRGRELDHIAFPLGGIGTGSISLGGWGQLRDFEIFNRPSKGLTFNMTFFTLWAKRRGEPAVTCVVQGPAGGSFTGRGAGVDRATGAGLPHFRKVEFEGAFPFARLHFDDPRMPLRVMLEAFNPFIPLNPDDSGLPVALFQFELTNPGASPVRAVLYANLENRTGWPEVGGGVIEPFQREGVRGLKMSAAGHPPDSPRYGTLALASPHERVLVQTHWLRGKWFDPLHDFWDQVAAGKLHPVRHKAEAPSGADVGTIALPVALAPGESRRLSVWIAWHVPNFEMYWHKGDPKPVWKNHYATRHADAVAVAEYLTRHQERLERETRAFADALFSSTLPAPVLDAISSQISILKSATCLRLTDGTFWGWEGCNPEAGCCAGTCSHVWNYAQALPYLFPSLERSIRQAEYRYSTQEDGHVTFRLPLPLGTIPQPSFHAAADGQMGGILKLYRDWLVCGDDDWLRALWPAAKKTLEYAWKHWDRDRDGVMEGVQHNTYDIEFYGPNTLTGSFYLGALRAAEEMARRLGDDKAARAYRRLFASGRRKMDAQLFNGEYFIQDVRCQAPSSHDPKLSIGGQGADTKLPGYPKYQYGKGCLADHLIGQWYARMLRLGDLFDPDHVRVALASIFRHNWRADLSEHPNPQRIYALNDEAGLLLCTWPRGARPGLPFPYCDEVWTGFEYQVAAHLIYEGLIEEGLAIVKAVRDRHTGVRRNPWNEFECGNHYARAMSSYSLMLALSGFFYNAAAQSLRFAPRINPDDFACFFSVDSGWGMIRQQLTPALKRAAVEVRRGKLILRELGLGFAAPQAKVTLAGRRLRASVQVAREGTTLRLARPVTIRAAQALTLESPA